MCRGSAVNLQALYRDKSGGLDSNLVSLFLLNASADGTAHIHIAGDYNDDFLLTANPASSMTFFAKLANIGNIFT